MSYAKVSQKIIYNQLRKGIQDIIRDLCKWKGVEILEGHMMPDHIHLLLSITQKYGISSFMGSQREKCDDDFQETFKSEIQIWKHVLWEYRILCEHRWLNEATIEKVWS